MIVVFGKNDILLRLMEMERQLELLDSALTSHINTEIQNGKNQTVKRHLLVDAKLRLLERKVKEIQQMSLKEPSNSRVPSLSSLKLELHYKTT
jgi:hypothetical protein